MRISRLSVENFRSIDSLIVDFPQMCALVGPNNAGKSNVLLAIQRVLGRDWVSRNTFDEDDVRGRDPERDLKVALSVDPPISYTRLKGTSPVAIRTLSFEYTRYKVGPQKGERRLEQACHDATGKQPMVLAKLPKKGQSHQYQPMVGIPSEVREAIPLIYIGTNRSLKEHLPGARYSLLRPLLEDVDRNVRDPAQITKVIQAGGEEIEISKLQRFQGLMTEVMQLLRTDDFEKLERTIKRNALQQLGFDPDTEADRLDFFFSPFDSIDFYKSLDLRVREGDFVISATELGEGIQNALVLAILKAFEERRKQGAIILIEEPEMFLHPQSLQRRDSDGSARGNGDPQGMGAVALRARPPLHLGGHGRANRGPRRGGALEPGLADLRTGTFAATVKAGDGESTSSECRVRVTVRRDVKRRDLSRETGGAFLAAGQSEAAGYGLYSYLLLGAPPSESSRERCLKAIEAYLALVPDVMSLEEYVPRRELNIFYLAVRGEPVKPLSGQWVLDNYDYARARSLLRALPGPNRDGPYILAAFRPLGRLAAGATSGSYLFQNLSSVPPHLAASWVREFLNQAAQERFWEERTTVQLAQRMRVTVGIMGAGLPEVRKALDGWIAWVR